MARKKRTSAQALSLPLSKGEIWEVGRRALEVSVADLARQGERPECVIGGPGWGRGGCGARRCHYLQCTSCKSWWILSSAPCVSHLSESHVDQK